jgi:hypothetical protein
LLLLVEEANKGKKKSWKVMAQKKRLEIIFVVGW